MKTILHKASERGFVDHGWLKAAHSFSFGNYYNAQKVNFGKLRVLNDDVVAPAKGFGLHPHENMEIITIPLTGALRHTDNMGNEEVISTNEVQVMSAGTGIWHSEFNASDQHVVNLLQIWILTNRKGHEPRYDQKKFSKDERFDKWQLFVSPDARDNSLWINQDAFISRFHKKNRHVVNYSLNSLKNGVYFIVIDGEAEIAGQILQKRDALGIFDGNTIPEIFFKSETDLLAIEVPMQ